MRRAAVLALIGLALGVAALLVWRLVLDAPQKVALAQAVRGPAVELVYATGFVEAEHPVSLSSRVTAPVEAVLVEEGQRVSPGQPLVRLDGSEQLALLEQAEAQARGRTLAEQRVTTLFRQGWVTKGARDEAVAAGQAARASVSALRARLDQMTIRAGIAGVVLKRDVEPGDLAVPGRQLMQLGDPALRRVTATVDERDIPRVLVGQAVLLSTDALPGKVLRGRVSEITPGGDPAQRAFRVRIALEDTADLPFGLTLEVNIVTRRRDNALLVPAGAVGQGHVWRLADGRAERRAVRTGIAGTERIEILSGLAAGDRVIVNPPEGLEDGDRVRP